MMLSLRRLPALRGKAMALAKTRSFAAVAEASSDTHSASPVVRCRLEPLAPHPPRDPLRPPALARSP